MEVSIEILLKETEVYIYDWPTARKRLRTKSEFPHWQSEDTKENLKLQTKLISRPVGIQGHVFCSEIYFKGEGKGAGNITFTRSKMKCANS